MDPILWSAFHVWVFYAALSVSCRLLLTCGERVDLLVLLRVPFPYGVSGQVWYLIVSIPYLYRLKFFSFYFEKSHFEQKISV